MAIEDVYHDPTVAIFWSPRCGFCRQMLTALTTLEREAPAGTPKLVMISAGEAEEVREEGFSSTVLLDPDGEAASAFGARGTPMAVLLSEDQIASPVAAGARAVFDLINAATVALDQG